MAIVRHFQRLILQDGADAQAFSGAELLAVRRIRILH